MLSQINLQISPQNDTEPRTRYMAPLQSEREIVAPRNTFRATLISAASARACRRATVRIDPSSISAQPPIYDEYRDW